MSVDIKILISVVSVSIAVFTSIRGLTKNIKDDASQMTTVIVKLENIGSGISDIKAEMSNLKEDVATNRERLIKVEESTRQAHKRLDEIKRIS